MNNIEVEFRSMVSEDKFNWLNDYLIQNSKDLGEDDKDTVFYIMPDKLFKVVGETSKNKGKIVLKNNHLGNSNNLIEWEVRFEFNDYDKAIDLFNNLGLPGKSMRAWQKRHNYEYKGVEIAVKFSEMWKHHVELEVVVSNHDEVVDAENKIKEVANELGIILMTVEEVKKFTQEAESKI